MQKRVEYNSKESKTTCKSNISRLPILQKSKARRMVRLKCKKNSSKIRTYYTISRVPVVCDYSVGDFKCNRELSITLKKAKQLANQIFPGSPSCKSQKHEVWFD